MIYMSENSKTTFNSEDFKNLKAQMQKAYAEAKTEYDEKKAKGEKIPQQPLGQKIIGIIILIVIVVLVGIVVALNFEFLFAPKNSVTFIVSDQNGDVIEGLRLYADSSNHSFTIEFDETVGINVTELEVGPGDYTVTFENVPENYNCPKMADNFTMSDGDKIELKYECTKEN